MPPATHPQLTEAEKGVLATWLDAGAAPSDEACESTPPANDMDDGQEVDTTGLECFQLLAHADGDKSRKFPVGVAVDAYYNMYFEAPWPEGSYAVVIKPIVDNAQAFHHWLLYRSPGGQDGRVEVSSGQHGDSELIHGWAPGGVALDFRRHSDDAVSPNAGRSSALENRRTRG